MIGYRVTTRSDVNKVIRKARRENPRRLGHGAALIRLTARRSIRTSKRPAPKGHPPHTRGQKRLRNAILYVVERQRERALAGPSHRIAGVSGGEHEHGLDWRKPMDERPFMQPALEKTAPRLPREWGGFVR